MNIELNVIGNESEVFVVLGDELIDLGHIIAYKHRDSTSKRNPEARSMLPDLSIIGINMLKTDKNRMNTIFIVEKHIPTLFITISDNPTLLQRIKEEPQSSLLIAPWNRVNLSLAIEFAVLQYTKFIALKKRIDSLSTDLGVIDAEELIRGLRSQKSGRSRSEVFREYHHGF